jgi:hypothetical protein
VLSPALDKSNYCYEAAIWENAQSEDAKNCSQYIDTDYMGEALTSCEASEDGAGRCSINFDSMMDVATMEEELGD